MMKRPTSFANRLLAALPPADLGLLAPHLQQISLKQDAVLVRSGDRNEQVYFPHSGTISFMLDMPNGQTVATSVIGNEGAVGRMAVQRDYSDRPWPPSDGQPCFWNDDANPCG
jgi:CRP-like cAMP-binding protein